MTYADEVQFNRDDVPVVQRFWVERGSDSVKYFFTCSHRIISIYPLMLHEIEQLPTGAVALPVVPRQRTINSEIDYGVPSEKTLGRIRYIGTQFGDDVNIVLENQCAIVYYLDSNPQAALNGNEDGHACWPVILFLEPEDFRILDVNCREEDMKFLKLSLRHNVSENTVVKATPGFGLGFPGIPGPGTESR